jgi:hypothetical protein
MKWSWVRLGLFAGAFLIGVFLSHSGLRHPSVSALVLNENAGTSLVVACNDGSVVVNPIAANRNVIQVHCLQSEMVVVRDHLKLENIPAFNRVNVRYQ